MKSGTLPSIAYGFKRCSLKHKIGPQEKFCNHYPPCQKAWAAGKRVVKFIGYDAGEHYRSDKVLLRDLADPKYSKWYPLMEWGWTRAMDGRLQLCRHSSSSVSRFPSQVVLYTLVMGGIPWSSSQRSITSR